ncbi:aminotransferase class I/II-fold pyridoxal phosphate-dependent enzyme [Neoroseomonas oryzicola]|uniref:Aminotransferase class I/II-fold pyridoxal phosphate-dependent enzyme n=1 Tax=Neoroseomonas oryzicola TaxID=535904 RepID=A0A9X9WP01_9PROT|nr:aminotransferase class I/II-fold pyridoxal phosphate-dependent enzyme [Neoroseomonas oryzicola]MBR0662061.1 aminotransferase class I/II-fold pyridoxal phosphate-dependent enzyme [Neoroseomonas oryzicola]NKE16316.1 aminotransferase class I/II-fold pyridoxal phosphate-dependent enzyme [Neoroseomonas oryzicola]
MSQGFGLSATARLALLQRLSKRREEKGPAPGAARAFRELPGQRDMEMIREAAGALGLENPFFRPHEGIAGATTRIGNREVVNYGSYNYLGLNGDPRVIAAAKAAMDRHGVSASASRMVSGERPVHGELEAAIAAHYGVEAAIAFVSGHATNVTVLGHLMGPRDLIVHDAAIHNSCAEGARLSGARRIAFAHNDWRAAERELAAARRGARRALIVIEGHYSMDGDIPDLPRFVDLARKHDAWLMVDEAHGLGVVGATGQGIHEQWGVAAQDVDIWMGTLSKTLSGCGGYIAGNADLIAWLKHSAPGFVYSVGMAPALAAASLESLRILHAEPERVARLQANAALFLRLAKAAGLDTGTSAGLAIVPVIVGSSVGAARLSQALLEGGINVQPILFPAVPDSSARLRFFLSSEHDDAQIRATVAAVAAAIGGARPAELAT